MLFWRKKPKKKSKQRTKTPSSTTRYEPKPFTPPPKMEIPKYIPKSDSSRKSNAKPDFKQLNPRRDFLKVFKQLTYRHRPWDVWRDFITMFACSLSNPVDKSHCDEREELYLKVFKRYSKQEQNLFPELCAHIIMALEINPEQDFLGDIFMELDLRNEHNGQFFTPYHVCELMAKVAIGDIAAQVKEKGYITISDPCCGAGATLIAGLHEAKRQLEKVGLNFQNHVLIAAQDVDYTVALMCYIQLSLLGIAGYIKIGNALTEPMSPNDSLENYWFTPMYFSKVWTMRRLFHSL